MILPHEIFSSPHPDAPCWVLLHGFLGSQRNLRTLAEKLSVLGPVLTLDLPNHGEAPHLDPCGYPEMAAAVAATIHQTLGTRPWVALGHSMGGKLAMYMALQPDAEMRGLVVLDIAPVVYHGTQDPVFDALLDLDLTQVKSRADADRLLGASIPERPIRLFVLTNLERAPENSPSLFRWRLPLDILSRNRLSLRGWPRTLTISDLPALLIWGTASPYVSAQNLAETQRYFPRLEDRSITGADHWLHVSHTTEVFDAIRHWAASYGKIS